MSWQLLVVIVVVIVVGIAIVVVIVVVAVVMVVVVVVWFVSVNSVMSPSKPVWGHQQQLGHCRRILILQRNSS